MRILSCLSEALSKSPARTRVRKVSHSARENAMIGPRGFLESRITTDCSTEATSTQLSGPLAAPGLPGYSGGCPAQAGAALQGTGRAAALSVIQREPAGCGPGVGLR